jgi:anthrone oxygenase-like protein
MILVPGIMWSGSVLRTRLFSEAMRRTAEFVAVLTCGLFAGAAVYLSPAEHPARMECGVEIAATEFPPSYRRATIVQATCAALGLPSSIAAWLAGATFWWAIAGAVLGSVIPFTLIVILPTNKRLLSSTLDEQSAETERLLARWGALHAVRSVLSGLALLLFLYLLIFAKP